MPEWTCRDERREQAARRERFISTFHAGRQSVLHAVLFTTFLGLAATGLPVRFSSTPWAMWLAQQVGGFGAISFSISCAP